MLRTMLLGAALAAALASAAPASADPQLAGRYTLTWTDAADIDVGPNVYPVLVTSCGAGCVTLNVDDGSWQEFRFDGRNWVSAREFLPDGTQCYNDGHTVGVWNHWVIEPSFAHGYSVAEPVDCGDGLQPIDPAVFDLSKV